MGSSKFSKEMRKFMYVHKTKLCFICNLISLILISTLLNFNGVGENAIIYTAVISILNLFVCASIIFWGTRDKKTKNDLKPIIENVTLDFIYKLHSPIVITDWKGYILWFNDAMSEFISESDINRKSISAVTHNRISIERFTETKEENINISLREKRFSVRNYKLSSYESELYVFTFDDITEFEAMKTGFELKEPVIAYFMADNLDEVTQKMQDKYRQVSGGMSDLLQGVTEHCGGIIKEYERDKYLCVFEARTLENFVKSKFSSILDTVREIKIEELNMSVTISGGVSNIEGTLFEKEAAARRALDLALQRGGDQIVVNSGASTEFYGGKTKTVQKKTKVRSRVVANELTALMKDSSNILIMGHRFADNDSIGACIGIARLAFSVNCKTNIIVNIHDKNLKSTFAKLRGLEEYKNIFVDETTALNMITSKTLIVVVDVNNPRYFESQAVYENAYKVAIIDHHIKKGELSKDPDVTYIEPSASSASELIAEILEQTLSPGELLKEEAELLLAGIILDTKQFLKNTGTRTFSAALYLRGEGGNPSDAVSVFKPSLEEFAKEVKFESNIVSNIIIYRNVIGISISETETHPSERVAGAKAADRMLTIEGVSASFVLFKIENAIHISARSLGSINVQIILEAFGGGGHFDSAGAQIVNSTMKDVLTRLKRTIDDYFDIV